ncbi:MAG: peptidylprolyl isomerase [Clostridia bacterium]|nr:peptidylprolyl isomerase [Clostridia bacterium]
MKKIISLILVVMLCMSVPVFADKAAGDIVISSTGDISTTAVATKLISDNKIIDGEKIIFNDRTLIPVRKLLESVGALVDWDGDTRRVDLTRNGKTISLHIDSDVLITPSGERKMDTTPILWNDTTYAPIRAIAEEFGLTVDWDGGTKTVLITSPEGCPYVDFYDGMTVAQATEMVGMTPEEFTGRTGLDYETYKDKLYVQADNEATSGAVAAGNGMSLEDLKTILNLADSVTESTPWGVAVGGVSMGNYINAFLNPAQYGMSVEQAFEQIKEAYNLGDEYTLDTKFRYVRVLIDTQDYLNSKAEAEAEQALAEQKAKDLAALPALLENTIGFTITLEDGSVMKGVLYPDVAPKTVENFVNLAKNHFYDGLIFHRVIDGFMIQGGGFDRNFNPKEAAPIQGEFYANGITNALKHEKGVISMARTNDPNSASSEFFIMDEAAQHLDGNYAAFGKITKGLEVIEKISAVQTETNALGYENVPVKPVVIKSITIG